MNHQCVFVYIRFLGNGETRLSIPGDYASIPFIIGYHAKWKVPLWQTESLLILGNRDKVVTKTASTLMIVKI